MSAIISKIFRGLRAERRASSQHLARQAAGDRTSFPMHQDWAFYHHEDGRYIDALVHLSDTSHENGEIRFLDGSHKEGTLTHITETPEGPCTPHLPTDQYRLEDTVPVPAKRGDVVCFNIHTIHGSYINNNSPMSEKP